MTAAGVVFDARWQLRLGGLPVSVVDELDDAAHRASFGAFWASLRRIADRQDALSARLHAEIAHRRSAGEDARPLVALRRALFQRDAEAVERSLAVVGAAGTAGLEALLGADAADVRSWLSHDRAHRDRFADTLRAQRDLLRGHASDPGFVRGVALSAPELVAERTRYAQALDTGRSVDKRGKRVERSVMSYVLRAAAKTTPFSTLGPVAFPDAGAVGSPAAPPGSRTTWSVYPLAHVLAVTSAQPDLVGGFRVRMSPYLRRLPETTSVDRATWTFTDVESRDDYAACVEAHVTLRSEGVIKLVEHVLDELGGETTWRGLADALVSAGGIPEDRAVELVTTLMRLGVVVAPALAIDATDEGGFASVLEQLASGGARGTRLAGLLAAYRDAARELAGIAEGEERAAHVRALRGHVADLYAEAGIESGLPRSVVYEDVVVRADDPGIARGLDVGPDVADALVRFIDLLDTSHLRRALLDGYYLHLVEAGEPVDDVAAFLRGLDSELLQSFQEHRIDTVADEDLADDPWLRWGGAWRGEAARRTMLARLRAQQRTLPLVGTDIAREMDAREVDLREELHDLLSGPPLVRAAYRHVNLLVQQDAATGVTVVNDCFGGIGFPLSRFTHGAAHREVGLMADVEAVAGAAGVRLMEISGGTVFSNLNLHEPVLSTRLLVPGDPVRPGSGAVRLESLALRWDERARRVTLVERATGTVVHPEYAGYLVPAATPRLHQSLSLLTPSATISAKPADLLQALPEEGTVVVRPRMALGGIVVVRAAVLLRAADLPAEDPTTQAGNLAWQRFWAHRALPVRSYARVLAEGAARRSKPFLLDAALIVCLSNLASRLRSAGAGATLELTEPLPAPEGAHDLGDGTRRVTEAMLGISVVDIPGEDAA
ncbi:lantibiotic dehydratase [Clavibacter capsici]|uniref:Lantibiotic dehydratase N-terminal domain-containing protein n=1 Tax=Clavibacter capsici TaxID=1874630 RepID=A0AAE7CCE2_9MICO|nr:lantibiotic dehydratase [Clavibacter capsici]ALD13444.1 hypothetical protein AES38_11380 [Clavibacter capsici]QIS45642.1 hypothetical protein GW570_11370 [Clavibacter capsici]